ncbi:MAG: hypothetical protein VB933_09715 [Pseudomonadales bacterium]
MAEKIVAVGFEPDPLQEASATLVPGLMQKYRGRVLIIAAQNCAVNYRGLFPAQLPLHPSPT